MQGQTVIYDIRNHLSVVDSISVSSRDNPDDIFRHLLTGCFQHICVN